ncbi:DNA-directed RNA polymerase subunit alpha [Candidatus Sumerlaeota bacterium]|nr:DNA-directed RNA polymerase subunit alpha [Candidatus Sumerlaeota bacterium]
MDFKPLIMPRGLQCESATRTDTYGRFHAEPFERGFGATVGNSLRRVLLSSIQGAAVTALRIDGVTHEYESIPGCKEDVCDIILNLKQVRISLTGKENETNFVLEATGPKVVTAGDFETGEDAQILNPDLVLATLAEDGVLRMEVHVAMGRGYVPAHKEADEEDVIGIIPVDSNFSPIVNVTYSVENARVGQRTDYDRLILDVTTDGTVSAEEAVSCAARILRDHLSMFIRAEEEQAAVAEAEEAAAEVSPHVEMEEKLGRSIEELELSVRSFNCLEAAGIKTIRDLVQKSESEMLKYRNFGRKSLSEIKNILKDMDLTFNMRIGPDGLPVEQKEKKE